MEERYENIIIGSGISGLLCGGYLSKYGQKTLILEKMKQVGGRAAYLRMGDYTVVMHIPLLMSSYNGGFWATAAKELDADIKLTYCKEPKLYIAGSSNPSVEVPKCVSVTSISEFAFDFLQRQFTEKLPEALKQEIGKLFKDILDMPFKQMTVDWDTVSLKDWVSARSSNPLIKHLFVSLAASMGFMGDAELTWEYASAAKMFVMFRAWIAGEGTPISAIPNLVDGICKPFADAVTAHGGEIRLEHTVKEVIIENNKAVGVRVIHNDQEKIIYGDRIIVSALWKQLPQLFSSLPAEVEECLKQPSQVHPVGWFVISMLDQPVTDDASFTMVVDPKTGTNLAGISAQSIEQPWNAPAGKQLIWMYSLHGEEQWNQKNKDDVVAEMNELLDQVFPGFMNAKKVQKDFGNEGTSHYALSACPKISQKSPDVEGLYFAGDGTAPMYGAIFEGAATTGISCAKNILGLDVLAGI